MPPLITPNCQTTRAANRTVRTECNWTGERGGRGCVAANGIGVARILRIDEVHACAAGKAGLTMLSTDSLPLKLVKASVAFSLPVAMLPRRIALELEKPAARSNRQNAVVNESVSL